MENEKKQEPIDVDPLKIDSASVDEIEEFDLDLFSNNELTSICDQIANEYSTNLHFSGSCTIFNNGLCAIKIELFDSGEFLEKIIKEKFQLYQNDMMFCYIKKDSITEELQEQMLSNKTSI